MSLHNESTVETAAFERFAGLGYALGHGPHLAPGEPAETEQLTDRIRGSVKQETLWLVSPENTKVLRAGIRRWLSETN